MRFLSVAFLPILACVISSTTTGCSSDSTDPNAPADGAGTTPPSSPGDDTNNPPANDPTTPGSTPGPGDVLLPSAKATAITAGSLHVCALTDQGGVRCWGYSDHGQIGNGVDDEKAYGVPVAVKGLDTGVKMVSATDKFTCAVTQANGVKCWGEDDAGQLGTGIPYTDNRLQQSSVPVDVKDLTSGVLAVSAGDVSSCALLQDHTVKCWGANGCWIGDGNDHIGGDTDTPDIVTASDTKLTDIAQISVAYAHACAVTTAGTVKCWGTNTFGESGTGSSSPRITVPTDVPGLTDVASVSAGARSTCAVLKSGALKCWGSREYGSLGDGQKVSFDDADTPIDVSGGLNASEIVTGNGFTCAVITGGLVKCWGDSDALGIDQTGYRTYQPANAVVGLSGVTHVTLGNDLACALLTGGAVKCWGTDAGEVLGNGTGNGAGDVSNTPVAVLSLP